MNQGISSLSLTNLLIRRATTAEQAIGLGDFELSLMCVCRWRF